MPTLRQTHVIASHMGTSSVDRGLLLLKRRIEERRRLGCLHEFIINIDFVLIFCWWLMLVGFVCELLELSEGFDSFCTLYDFLVVCMIAYSQ
jgi:hypothetical protein